MSRPGSFCGTVRRVGSGCVSWIVPLKGRNVGGDAGSIVLAEAGGPSAQKKQVQVELHLPLLAHAPSGKPRWATGVTTALAHTDGGTGEMGPRTARGRRQRLLAPSLHPANGSAAGPEFRLLGRHLHHLTVLDGQWQWQSRCPARQSPAALPRLSPLQYAPTPLPAPDSPLGAAQRTEFTLPTGTYMMAR